MYNTIKKTTLIQITKRIIFLHLKRHKIINTKILQKGYEVNLYPPALN